MRRTFTFVEIGVVHSPYKKDGEAPKQGFLRPEVTGELEIYPEYAGAISTLNPGDEMNLVFIFDRSEGYDLISERKGGAGEIRGLFSTRSPRRINPIGISDIVVKEINGLTVTFSGVDMLDGTPVIDLKPVIR